MRERERGARDREREERERNKQRGRGREGERERETDRQTDRQRDRETERQRDRETDRQRQTEKWLTESNPFRFDTISHHPPPIRLNTPSLSLPHPIHLNLKSHLPYPCLSQDQAAND